MRWLALPGMVMAAALVVLGLTSSPRPGMAEGGVVRESALEGRSEESESPVGLESLDVSPSARDLADSEGGIAAAELERHSLSFRPLLPDGVAAERVAYEVVGAARGLALEGKHTVAAHDGLVRIDLDVPPRDLTVDGPEAELFARAVLRVATAEKHLDALSGAALLSRKGVAAAAIDLSFIDAGGTDPVDLGVLQLEEPPYLGEVVFAGTWTEVARLEVTRSVSGTSGAGAIYSDRLRRTVRASRGRVALWAFGESPTWSVSASPLGDLPSGAGALVPVRMRSVSVEDRGLRGDSIELSLPFRSGLDLSVDLFAAPRAGRLVILAAGADPAPMSAGATLGRDAYNERIGAAVWTNVVPRGPVKKGKASYDIGMTDLPEGPLRLELWSIDDDQDVRELLAARSVSAGSDMLRVSLP